MGYFNLLALFALAQMQPPAIPLESMPLEGPLPPQVPSQVPPQVIVPQDQSSAVDPNQYIKKEKPALPHSPDLQTNRGPAHPRRRKLPVHPLNERYYRRNRPTHSENSQIGPGT